MADSVAPPVRNRKLCRFVLTPKGCKFGSDCRFLHSDQMEDIVKGDNEVFSEHYENTGSEEVEELKKDNSSESLIPKIARNSSETDSCIEPNNEGMEQGQVSERKEVVCRFFQGRRGCARGKNCRFAHVRNERSAEPSGPKKPPKNAPEQAVKRAVRQSDKSRPHQKVLQPVLDNINGPKCSSEEVSKQPSTNEQAENVDPRPNKNSSEQGTSCGKDGTSTEAATVVADENLEECYKLRSTEIQQLRRRFGGQQSYCEELKENAWFKVKFKPTDPDWPFKIEAVYLTVCFPDDYPKHIFDVFLSEGQGLPLEIVKYANQRILQWTKSQKQTGVNQANLKLYFRPFLRWFDRSLESLFIDGGRQMRMGYITGVTDKPSESSSSDTAPDSCNSQETGSGSKSAIIPQTQDRESASLQGSHRVGTQTTVKDYGHDTPNVSSSRSCHLQSSDIGKSVESQNIQDTCNSIVLDSQNKDRDRSAPDLFSGTPNVGTTVDSNIGVTNLTDVPTNISNSSKEMVSDSKDPEMDTAEEQMSILVPKRDKQHIVEEIFRSNSSPLEVKSIEGIEDTALACQPDSLDTEVDTASGADVLSSVRRGTEIQCKGLELVESTSTLRAVKVGLTVECSRCRQRIDTQLSGSGSFTKSCTRCFSVLGVAYNPALVHQFSSVLGFLDLDGCFPFDVVLPESEFMLGCLDCSKETSIKGLQYGANRSWCKLCHQKLGFQIQSIRFYGVQLHLETVSLKKSSVPSSGSKPKKSNQSMGIKEGEPLPGNGTCKHYKKSYRWLRFPCCGKCYPCDLCHEESEAHEMKFANRMICGFCSREQPYSQQPCSGCKASVTKAHSTHWEGGRGCRDKITMSRNDDQKYKQSGKTTSRKAQKLSEPKGKGKARK